MTEIVNLEGEGVLKENENGKGKEKKTSYEITRKCHDKWVLQHPWAEMIGGS